MKLKSVSGRDLGLKAPYRMNLAFGFGISAAAHIFIALLAVLFLQKGASLEARIPVRIVDSYEEVIKLYPVIRDPAPIKPNPVTVPSGGIPISVPDSLAPDYVDVPTMDQLFQLASNPVGWDGGEAIIVDVNSIINDILPPPDTFIAFEEAPVPVRSADPVYPDLARKAGIEADIWIKVLIDKNGAVRDVLISKPSEKTIDFEKAAVAAAYSTVWKPAIANGNPVAVWVTYKVSFKLR